MRGVSRVSNTACDGGGVFATPLICLLERLAVPAARSNRLLSSPNNDAYVVVAAAAEFTRARGAASNVAFTFRFRSTDGRGACFPWLACQGVSVTSTAPLPLPPPSLPPPPLLLPPPALAAADPVVAAAAAGVIAILLPIGAAVAAADAAAAATAVATALCGVWRCALIVSTAARDGDGSDGDGSDGDGDGDDAAILVSIATPSADAAAAAPPPPSLGLPPLWYGVKLGGTASTGEVKPEVQAEVGCTTRRKVSSSSW